MSLVWQNWTDILLLLTGERLYSYMIRISGCLVMFFYLDVKQWCIYNGYQVWLLNCMPISLDQDTGLNPIWSNNIPIEKIHKFLAEHAVVGDWWNTQQVWVCSLSVDRTYYMFKFKTKVLRNSFVLYLYGVYSFLGPISHHVFLILTWIEAYFTLWCNAKFWRSDW